MRLIDADALREKALPASKFDPEMLVVGLGYVFSAPTIDPVKHGQWIGEGDGYADGEMVYDVWHCSECDYCIDDGTDDPEKLPHYCPACGAKMDANE